MGSEINREELDAGARFIHLGLAGFGVLAWLTGYLAGDYKTARYFWFNLHKWCGLGLAGFLACRLGYGFWGPEKVRFAYWLPYTKERLLRAWEDLLGLLNLRLPERQPHQGLSGVVEAFGLAVYSWMAVTGALMYFLLQPGRKAMGLAHAIKEVHEVGEWLIPAFLAVHVGAVALHALAGNHLWRKTFFLKD